jgi:SAM-dependent methyltransferase
MDDVLAYTEINRRGWDVMAADRPARGAAFYRDGGTTLDDVETEALPDVSGRTFLHLACANGNDSLSWAARGARVTGVDISAVAIEAARQQAVESGLDARFVAADMFDLPDDLGRFDVVHASWGVVCWVPDVDRWLSVVVEHLNDGGTFFLAEHHPVWEALGAPDDEGRLRPVADYFGRHTPSGHSLDPTRHPRGWTEDVETASFVWPVSDVVSAMTTAGLKVEHFSEHPLPELYDGMGDAASRLPAVYLVRAVRS